LKQDEIIEMAIEAGFLDADDKGVWITDGYWTKELEALVKLVEAKATAREREACAKVCDKGLGKPYAQLIRARGEA